MIKIYQFKEKINEEYEINFHYLHEDFDTIFKYNILDKYSSISIINLTNLDSGSKYEELIIENTIHKGFLYSYKKLIENKRDVKSMIFRNCCNDSTIQTLLKYEISYLNLTNCSLPSYLANNLTKLICLNIAFCELQAHHYDLIIKIMKTSSLTKLSLNSIGAVKKYSDSLNNLICEISNSKILDFSFEENNCYSGLFEKLKNKCFRSLKFVCNNEENNLKKQNIRIKSVCIAK